MISKAIYYDSAIIIPHNKHRYILLLQIICYQIGGPKLMSHPSAADSGALPDRGTESLTVHDLYVFNGASFLAACVPRLGGQAPAGVE